MKNLGEGLTTSLVDGINSKSEWMKEQILKFCSLVSDSFNVGFGMPNLESAGVVGVNSGSVLGTYRPDYTEQLNSINDAVDRLIGLVGEYLPNISSNASKPVVVDANSLAVGMSRNIDSELGKISVSKNRGNV